MTLQDRRVQSLLEDLAGASATPGGGAAAALAGAMGAALVSMVCRLSVGKERFADVEEELGGVLEKAEAARQMLVDLADADARAFDQVMAAYRLPKETQEGQAARREAIQAALKGATQVPLETARACAAVLKLADQVIPKINPNALSDAGAAALLAEAGLRGAQLNVVINLGSLRDSDFVRVTRENLSRALSGADQAKERVFSYVINHV